MAHAGDRTLLAEFWGLGTNELKQYTFHSEQLERQLPLVPGALFSRCGFASVMLI